MAGGLDPIRYIEMEQAKPSRLRLFLIVIAILTAAVAFTVGINSLLGGSSGWQGVEAYPDGMDCSGDFSLQYEFVGGGAKDTASYKKLSALYTLAMEEACGLFYPHGGVALLNANPNRTVEVEPALYQALELLQNSGTRYFYLAPVNALYEQVFLCEDESQAARVDPNRDDELGQYAAQLAHFANDPAHIEVKLLGEGSVRLNVSEEYLSFAAENGVDCFVDFGWMTNAFMVDHMAQRLVEGGYTNGFLASYDGFTRNLDGREGNYSLNLFHREGKEIHLPAVMDYAGPVSIVNLRSYPMSDADRWHYFTYSDGSITSIFVAPESGRNESALPEATALSGDMGCAELALTLAPHYLRDGWEAPALRPGMSLVWFDGKSLRSMGDGVCALTRDGEMAGYQIFG